MFVCGRRLGDEMDSPLAWRVVERAAGLWSVESLPVAWRGRFDGWPVVFVGDADEALGLALHRAGLAGCECVTVWPRGQPAYGVELSGVLPAPLPDGSQALELAMYAKRKGGAKARPGGSGAGSFGAGVDAALRAVRAQLSGRGPRAAAKGRKGVTGRVASQAPMGRGDFEDGDYADMGRGPLRIGHRR